MHCVLKNQKPIRSQYPDLERYALRPNEIWSLLEKCWATEPKERPTIDEAIKELESMDSKVWGYDSALVLNRRI
jgi:Ser/Thr protein kinase RdoA (MazF antagonist)